jgi:hypothetical protein
MRAGLERMNFVKHDQDVGAVSRTMARRRKALKAAKYLCDGYLVLNRAETKPRMTAGDSTACLVTLLESHRLPDGTHQRPHRWDVPRGHLPKSDNLSWEQATAGSAQVCSRHLSWADQVRNA